jgi:hypothetical protein
LFSLNSQRSSKLAKSEYNNKPKSEKVKEEQERQERERPEA